MEEKLLKKITDVKSYNGDRGSINKVVDSLLFYLKGCPFKTKRYSSAQQGDLVVLNSLKRKRGLPNILLVGHTDIVPLPEFTPFSKKGNKYYGNGVADMKSGLVVMASSIRELAKENCLWNISLAFVPDEETGSFAYKSNLARLYKKQDFAFVFEPALEEKEGIFKTERWVVFERKGIKTFKIKITGEGGHSGNKIKNRDNPIEEAAQKIIKLAKLTDLKKGITLNAGLIKGGEASNIIPRECELVIESRALKLKHLREAEKKINKIALSNFYKNLESSISQLIFIPPLEINRKGKILLSLTKEVFKEKGIRLIVKPRGGGSDGNQIAQFGAGVIDGLGGVGGRLHTPKEWVYADSIRQSKEMTIGIIKKLLKI
jgi:glutamate carboxypeptidase